MDAQTLSRETGTWWRLPKVMEETGLSRATIYRLMGRGNFPPNRALRSARAKVWIATEVLDWKASEMVPVADTGIGDLL